MVAQNPSAGIAYSVAASTAFAGMYYYVTLLQPLNAEQIYGWRILLTAPVLAVMLVLGRNWHEVVTIVRRAAGALWLVPLLVVTSFLLAIQQWIFMWAPLHGYGLDVSLGFFLLPLTMALTGRLVFGERLTRTQLAACLLAAVGVANELLFAPRLSWPVFVVCLGYPVYFVLRKRMGTANLGGMWVDLALSAPVGIAFILLGGSAMGGHAPGHFAALVLGLACLSSAGVGCMFLASHRLSLTLFGLLGYLEPVLLVAVSLVLGERIAPAQWWTYGPIWLAVLVLMAEGLRAAVRQSRA